MLPVEEQQRIRFNLLLLLIVGL